MSTGTGSSIRITGSTSSLEPGQVIGLGTAAEHVLLFDPDLERADQMSVAGNGGSAP